MNKIWYILINEKQEGPFSIEELKQDKRLTPDTLACRAGWNHWKSIRDIPELKELFEEQKPAQPDEETEEEKKKNMIQEELVLDLGEEPPYLLWLLVALIALLYVFFRLYSS